MAYFVAYFVTQHTEELVELYVGAGMSLRQIEAVTGIPFSTVRDRLVAGGVRLRKRGAFRGNNNGAKISYERRVEAAFLYEKMKWTTTEIGEHFGARPTAVRQWLVSHGVKMRPHHESARLRWTRKPKRYTGPRGDPRKRSLTRIQKECLAAAELHGKVVVDWQWGDEPNAFAKKTLSSLVGRGLLRYVDPVEKQADGTWLVKGYDVHPYYELVDGPRK